MYAMAQGKVDGRELVFAEVLHVLGLHVVGTQGLPYPEVLVRQEKLTYYTQLAAVSKMAALFRSVKERHVQAQARLASEARHHGQQGGEGGGGRQSSVMSASMVMNPPPQSSRMMIACKWRL